MNFKKLTVSNKIVFVNFDNVTEIHKNQSGSTLYFNSMASDEDQSYINVDESMQDVEHMLFDK